MRALDQDAFERTTLIQDAVIRNLEVLGEAANRIGSVDPHFSSSNHFLQLDLAYRMRNALIHDYDAVNLVTVWNTVTFGLPALKRQIEDLLRA